MTKTRLNPTTDKLLNLTKDQISYFCECEAGSEMKAFNRNGKVIFCYVVNSIHALIEREMSFETVMEELQHA